MRTSVGNRTHIILSNNIGFDLVRYHVVDYLIWKLLENVFCELGQVCSALIALDIFFNFNKLDDISESLLV